MSHCTNQDEIKLLPEDIANQIAAGEVVERPSSVVKELVENAIDAGSTEIIVDIQNGGRDLRITDNGKGISPEQVQLAFRRFATSKLREESDLWTLATMGFRGEALASIASISKIEMHTKTKDSNEGTKVVIEGSIIKNTEVIGCSEGTTLIIKDLFFNTPARLKFLKSDSTEIKHIIDLMNAIAISHSHISFSVINKSRETIRTNGGNSTIRDAVRQIYGKDVSQNMVDVEHTNSYGSVRGLTSKSVYSRSDRNRQIFFVNNRWVRLPFMNKILGEIYSDMIPSHKYPVSIISLNLPKQDLDVNVHPTKKEVRFNTFSKVYELVYRGIVNALYPVQDYTSNQEQENETSEEHNNERSLYNDAKPINVDDKITPVYPSRQSTNYSYEKLNQSPNRYSTPPKEGTYQAKQFSFYDELREYKVNSDRKENLEEIKPIGIIYKNYIIGYLGNDLCFIDQHLAHERYLYEQLELDVKSKQDLLTAIMVQLPEAEFETYKNNESIFEEYGYDIQEFGNNTLIMRAIPSVVNLEEAENVFRKVIGELLEEGVAKKDLDKFKYLKKTIACKAAIKAGDYLDLEEAKILIKNWAKTKQPYTCPHGRPAIYRLPKSSIDKHFNRTW